MMLLCKFCILKDSLSPSHQQTISQHAFHHNRNALGSPMPINQQATYLQGEEIVIDVTLTAHHKGHFEFAACAISEGEIPTKGEGWFYNSHTLLLCYFVSHFSYYFSLPAKKNALNKTS
jgi:hypothetical protein